MALRPPLITTSEMFRRVPIGAPTYGGPLNSGAAPSAAELSNPLPVPVGSPVSVDKETLDTITDALVGIMKGMEELRCDIAVVRKELALSATRRLAAPALKPAVVMPDPAALAIALKKWQAEQAAKEAAMEKWQNTRNTSDVVIPKITL